MSQEDGVTDDGLEVLASLKAIFEAQQMALLDREDITPEIYVIIAELDMNKIVSAGGIPEFLRAQIRERRGVMEAALAGKPEQIQNRIRSEVEKEIVPLEEAVAFVEKK